MGTFSRVVVAAAFVAGFGGIAQAQSRSWYAQTDPARYDALFEGRSSVIDRPVEPSGAIPPSESRTVMGLSVPR